MDEGSAECILLNQAADHLTSSGFTSVLIIASEYDPKDDTTSTAWCRRGDFNATIGLAHRWLSCYGEYDEFEECEVEDDPDDE